MPITTLRCCGRERNSRAAGPDECRATPAGMDALGGPAYHADMAVGGPAPGRWISMRWFGATAGEAQAAMPGDALVGKPLYQITQALTVRAAPGQIWPWLMQTGQRQAGFYSDSRVWDACVDLYYRVLSRERRVPRERYAHADDRIHPGWQDRAVGDRILDGPPGTAYYVVVELVPERVKVSFTDTHLPYLLPARCRPAVRGELSDATILGPRPDGTTRVVHRVRFSAEPWWFRLLAVPVVLIWGEAITSRRFLRGLRSRAEGTTA